MQKMWNELSLADHYRRTSKRIRKGSGVGSTGVVKERRADVAGRLCDDSGQTIVDDEGIHNE